MMTLFKKIILTIVVFVPLMGQAQQLFNIDNQVVFGGDNLEYSFGNIQLSNGTFLVFGQSESSYSGNLTVPNFGMEDIYLINYNADFTINWQKNYGGNYSDAAFNLINTNDGGFLICGNSNSTSGGNKTAPNYGDFDVWLIKCDIYGNKQWEKTYGGNNREENRSVKQLNNNNFIVFCSSYSSVSGNKTSVNKGGSDYWVLYLDEQGNMIWDKSYGGNLSEHIDDAIIDENGNIYLAGNSFSNISGDKSQNNFDTTHSTSDIWVVKIDANGDIIWDKSYGNDSNNSVSKIVKSDNSLYLAFNIDGYATPNSGNVTSQTTNNTSGSDYLLMKLDTDGNILWDKNYGGDLSEGIIKVIVVNNSLILIGYSDSNISGDKTENSRGGNDVWCVLVNKEGDVIKDKTIGGANNDTYGFVFALNYNRFFIGIDSNSGVSGDKTIPNYDNFGDIWIVDVSTTIDLGIKESKTAKILYGPNPTHNQVTFTNLNQNFSYLTVYDIQGKVIAKNISVKNLNTYQLNLNVKKGIYFAKLTTTNNTTQSVKIIVN